MNDNNLATERFCIWEEKNSIGPLTNCESKNELEMNDIISSTEEKLESETSNDTTKKWARKCPKCEETIYYVKEYNSSIAEKKHSYCLSCSQKELYISKKRKPRASKFFGKKLEKQCIKCGNVQTYKNIKQLTKAIFNNTLCKSCSGKQNGNFYWIEGPGKSIIEKIQLKTWSKNCPRCNALQTYKNKRNFDKMVKKNSVCRKCQLIIRRPTIFERPNYNPKACDYFDKLSKEKEWDLHHALNGGEFQVFKWWVDAYDKDKNIVVEYDEPSHYDKSGQLKKRDVIRQNEIVKRLKCDFYRYDEKRNKLNAFPFSISEPGNSCR